MWPSVRCFRSRAKPASALLIQSATICSGSRVQRLKAEVHLEAFTSRTLGSARVDLILLLIAAQSAASEPVPEQVPPRIRSELRILPQLDACVQPSASDEIIVCARRGDDDRYRIPKEFRNQEEAGRRIAGPGSASLDTEPFAPCGIFEGQRKCNKADAAEFGYGNGRDLITVVGKVIAAIADPE